MGICHSLWPESYLWPWDSISTFWTPSGKTAIETGLFVATNFWSPRHFELLWVDCPTFSTSMQRQKNIISENFDMNISVGSLDHCFMQLSRWFLKGNSQVYNPKARLVTSTSSRLPWPRDGTHDVRTKKPKAPKYNEKMAIRKSGGRTVSWSPLNDGRFGVCIDHPRLVLLLWDIRKASELRCKNQCLGLRNQHFYNIKHHCIILEI